MGSTAFSYARRVSRQKYSRGVRRNASRIRWCVMLLSLRMAWVELPLLREELLGLVRMGEHPGNECRLGPRWAGHLFSA